MCGVVSGLWYSRQMVMEMHIYRTILPNIRWWYVWWWGIALCHDGGGGVSSSSGGVVGILNSLRAIFSKWNENENEVMVWGCNGVRRWGTYRYDNSVDGYDGDVCVSQRYNTAPSENKMVVCMGRVGGWCNDGGGGGVGGGMVDDGV